PRVLYCCDPSPCTASPLSLHDALPICSHLPPPHEPAPPGMPERHTPWSAAAIAARYSGRTADSTSHPDPVDPESHNAHAPAAPRSEEHTSELQSRENLVCRLLLEKKKT